MPNHYIGDLLHTIAMSGLSRERTELLHLVIVPARRHIQYRCTASLRAIATFAIFRPRPMKTPKRSGCTLGQRVLHSVLSARLLEELVGTLKTRRHIRQSMEVNRRKSALTLSTTGITTR